MDGDPGRAPGPCTWEFNNRGIVQFRKTFTYDANGKLLIEESLDAEGTAQRRTTYTNQKGERLCITRASSIRR